MNEKSVPDGCVASSGRDWTKVLAKYRQSSNRRGTVELLITALPLLALWSVTCIAISYGYWIGLLLVLPAAGFLVRLFIIQHDCGHGSFFRQQTANNWTGRVIGVLTLTPYGFWRRAHAIHHASSGCLDRRGLGDIDTLTVNEYRELSWWARLQYRLMRHPIVLFGIAPAYVFVIRQRIPLGLMRNGWQPWFSAMGTNLAIFLSLVAIAWTIGFEAVAFVYLPTMLLAGTIGIWMFFVQHQFEETSWDEKHSWQWHDAALHGSSHYDLPHPLRWITANIGIHHVHHLCSRIPYYRLPSVLRDHPELRNVGRLTLLESLRCVSLVLWDEKRRRLVSFRTANSSP